MKVPVRIQFYLEFAVAFECFKFQRVRFGILSHEQEVPFCAACFNGCLAYDISRECEKSSNAFRIQCNTCAGIVIPHDVAKVECPRAEDVAFHDIKNGLVARCRDDMPGPAFFIIKVS